jgi:protein gp37
MSTKTSIEWTRGDDGAAGATWNPVTGCTEVSDGCDHCYAKTFAERWRGTPGHYFEHGFDVQLRPDKLDLPLRWRKPRRIFVNSMSDLFHDQVPDDYIVSAFGAMLIAQHHTFQVLTKRHGRMRSLLNQDDFADRVLESADQDFDLNDEAQGRLTRTWPLPNVWLGVSTENQQWADIRIPALLETPAAVRWISAEPLLGPIDLDPLRCPYGCGKQNEYFDTSTHTWQCVDCVNDGAQGELCGGWWLDACPENGGINWVVVGGESGPRHRPLDLDWVRHIRDRCQQQSVPLFLKQIGGLTPKSGGRQLDGRTWDEYPSQLPLDRKQASA